MNPLCAWLRNDYRLVEKNLENLRHIKTTDTVFICISASLRSLNVKLITSGKDEFWPGRATVGLRCTSDSIEGRREIVEKFYNWCGEE